jgi:hypothetical protein
MFFNMVQGTNFPPISQEKGAKNNHDLFNVLAIKMLQIYFGFKIGNCNFNYVINSMTQFRQKASGYVSIRCV